MRLSYILLLITAVTILPETTLSGLIDSSQIDSALAPASLPASPTDSIIRHIYLYGNRVTKDALIRSCLQIDTGMAFDTSSAGAAKRRLQATELFTKVDLVPLFKADGVHLYVIVNEMLYLSLSDLGGELYSSKYDQNNRDWWWRLRLGVSHRNFRGRMEELRTSVSIWDWRSLGLSWYKPIVPSPYFFGLGGSIDQRPDEYRHTDYTDIIGRASVGRHLLERSKINLSIIPTFRRHINVDSTQVVDTLRYYESFGAVTWATDHRGSSFDPSSGWHLISDIRTNYLYSGVNSPFLQLMADMRVYFPGLFYNNKFAFRFLSILRNTDAGSIHRIQLGGDGSVRGYARRALGNDAVANDALLMTLEYRFPLYRSPFIEFPMLSLAYKGVTSTYFRIDGALILDYTRMYSGISDIFDFAGANNAIQTGTGLGFGLRALFPSIKRSVCADFVWGERNRNNIRSMSFTWPPAIHTYIDMNF